MTTKIVCVGDIHIDCKAPASRKDSYAETVFGKLEQIDRIAEEVGASAVICTGDVLNRKSVTIPFIVDFINRRRNAKPQWYTVAGNHDLFYGRSASIEKTPLGILYASGVLQDCTKVTRIRDVNVQGLHYDRECNIPEQLDDSVVNILVLHKYTDRQYAADEDYIVPAAYKHFDIVIAGHDHMPYPTKKTGKCTLIRPGALTRKTSSIADQERKVVVSVLTIESKSSIIVEDREIEVMPIEDTYIEKKLDEKANKKELLSFIEDLKRAPSEAQETLTILKELCGEDAVVYDTCVQYLKEKSLV